MALIQDYPLNIDDDGIQYFYKDPDDVLDYFFDWAGKTNGNWNSDWLASGEEITSKTVTAEAGITEDSSAINAAKNGVTVWLSGGTAGQSYEVSCKAVTNQGRTVEKTMRIYCKQR